MALKETIKRMRQLLCELQRDLDKSERENRTASQRVRTGTVKLAKIAKVYRKESVTAEKKRGNKKKKR